MRRAEGWEQALVEMTASKLRAPWAWGVHDCVIFAADCIFAMTGEDLAEDFRGRYDNESEAWATLANIGHKDLGSLVSSRLPEIEPRDAGRGDVVLMPGEQGDFIAICDGRTAVGPKAPRGINHNPMTAATRAWRVD